MEIREVVVVDAIRTPLGKHGGVLGGVRPDDLAALAIAKVVERNRLQGSAVDDVYIGCGNQAGEDNRNVARMAALLSGLPCTVPAVTVNRNCASGLDAVNQAANSIAAGMSDVIIAGGVESMTRAPYVMPKSNKPFERGLQIYDTTLGWRLVNARLSKMYPPISMGETAENLAEKYGIGRQEQDEFALGSHRRAVSAMNSGKFKDEIVPVPVNQEGRDAIVERDEGPRPDTSAEALAKLKPVYRAGGSVTAGNSSQVSDGAAAVLMMSRDASERLGLRPLARFVASAVAGVDPSYMGIGPVPATMKVLARAGWRADELDLIEINEAFAAQILAVIRDLALDTTKLNPNGGAIALGHPIGCSGARLVATLLHEMKRSGRRKALVSLCVGVGQGVATLFESPS